MKNSNSFPKVAQGQYNVIKKYSEISSIEKNNIYEPKEKKQTEDEEENFELKLKETKQLSSEQLDETEEELFESSSDSSKVEEDD